MKSTLYMYIQGYMGQNYWSVRCQRATLVRRYGRYCFKKGIGFLAL